MPKIGPYTLHSIETGRFRLDGGAMFGIVPKPLWERYIPADEANRIPLHMRCLLLEAADRLILIDNGIGDKGDAKFNRIFAVDQTASDLHGSLAAAGFAAADVTDVILTHLHFDHCGGSTRRGSAGLEIVFPNARFHVQRKHWAWGRAPNPREQGSFLEENLAPLAASGQLHLLDGDGPLFPGIDVLTVNGHTEAQQMVKITGPEGTLVFVADLLPTAAHLPLAWVMAYDIRPLVTVDEKAAFLEKAVENDWQLFFEHDPEVAVAGLKRTEKGIAAAAPGRWRRSGKTGQRPPPLSRRPRRWPGMVFGHVRGCASFPVQTSCLIHMPERPLPTGVPILRLATILLVPLTLLLFGAAMYLLHSAGRTADEAVQTRVKTTAVQLAQTASTTQREVPQLAKWAREDGFTRLWVVGPTGRILASNRAIEIGTPMDETAWYRLKEAAGPSLTLPMRWEGEPLRLAAHHDAITGQWGLALYDEGPLQAARFKTYAWILGLSLIGWLVLAGTVFMMLRVAVVRPLGRVQAVVGRLLEGEPPTDATLERLWAETERTLGGHVETLLAWARLQRDQAGETREAEARFRALADGVPALVFIGSLDGFLLEANRTFADVLGLHADQVHGCPLSVLAQWLPVEAVMREAQESRENRYTPVPFDAELRARDGRSVPVRMHVQTFRYHGRWAFLAVASDGGAAHALVQERALLKEAFDEELEAQTAPLLADRDRLTEAMRLLEPVLDTPGLLVAAFDAEMQTHAWSRVAATLTGIGREDIPDIVALVERLMPEPTARRTFVRWLERSEERPFEAVFERPDGQRLRIAWTSAPAVGGGGVLVGRVLAEEEERAVAPAQNGAAPPSEGPPAPPFDGEAIPVAADMVIAEAPAAYASGDGAVRGVPLLALADAPARRPRAARPVRRLPEGVPLGSLRRLRCIQERGDVRAARRTGLRTGVFV